MKIIGKYRPNVGIIICNYHGKLLLARRYGKKNSWQFPQGGIDDTETVNEAMYRELFEEVGLKKDDVRILAYTKYWIKYNIPKNLIRLNSIPLYIGQKQKWFLLKLMVSDKNINLNCNCISEFDKWCWVNFWYPMKKIVFFKRHVYRKVLEDFFNVLFNFFMSLLF
ncbi:MAG: RNA pyrophosphohydrolase [Candidatus Westeberhardia cardiocondylae]|nr:RNA pyrophosphohydrolase [Candidatus Westeberhardia cardiocondylae]